MNGWLRGLGVIFVLFGLNTAVWGQAQMRTFRTDTGCSILMIASATVEQPVQWTGRCENGVGTGVGILSYQFDAGPRGKVRWHLKTLLQNGKQTGVNWFVSDPVLRYQNADGATPMILNVRRDGEQVSRKALQANESLEQALQSADAMVNEARNLGLSSMTVDVLKNDIKQWYQNPTQYTGSGSASSIAGSTPATQQQQSSAQTPTPVKPAANASGFVPPRSANSCITQKTRSNGSATLESSCSQKIVVAGKVKPFFNDGKVYDEHIVHLEDSYPQFGTNININFRGPIQYVSCYQGDKHCGYPWLKHLQHCKRWSYSPLPSGGYEPHAQSYPTLSCVSGTMGVGKAGEAFYNEFFESSNNIWKQHIGNKISDTDEGAAACAVDMYPRYIALRKQLREKYQPLAGLPKEVCENDR